MRTPQEIFESEIRDGIIDGCAVLSGRPDGRELFRLECGFADRKRTVPMRSDSVIDLASVTKAAATVTALLIAHSRGKIDLDAPFTEYLPGYKPRPDSKIRVRDLANHRSGFIDVPGEPVRRYFNESGLVMRRNMLELLPPAPPTAEASYACWNYILLCMILEQVMDTRLPDFCRREIFLPLGMTSSSVGAPLPELPEERLAQTFGTARPGVISDFVAVRIYRDGETTGNAGMFSSAEDLAKLLTCYLNHGEYAAGKRLFSKRTFQEIAPDTADRRDGYRRFGWVIADQYLCPEAVGTSLVHSGWSGQTVFMNFEKNIFTVVLTTRSGDYDRAKAERFEVINQLYKKA